MTIRTGDNNFAPAQFIVDGTSGQGTHTTIAAALSDSSSGDTIFVKPGTYTEDLTLVAGVNLTAYTGDALSPNVNIVGMATATFSGTCTISNISLTTNLDTFLTISGTNATIVYIKNCYLDMIDNDGFVFTSSNSGAKLIFLDCQGDIGITGVKIFNQTSPGTLNFQKCYILNSGGSTTASTQSNSGSCEFDWCTISSPITTSGSSNMSFSFTTVDTSALNVTGWTVGGSGSNSANNCAFSSGSASPISVSTSVTLRSCSFISSASSLVGGAGTVVSNYLSQTQSSSGQWIAMDDQTDTFGIYNNAGSPESAVTANIGSIGLDTSNGVAYIKTTDSSNTGWIPIGGPAGQVVNVTLLDDTDSTYTVLTSDYYMSCNVSAGILDIDLPNAPTTGSVWIVKDSGGDAATNNITVSTVGGVVTIDGSTSYVMNTDFQAAQFIFNGTSYEVF